MKSHTYLSFPFRSLALMVATGLFCVGVNAFPSGSRIVLQPDTPAAAKQALARQLGQITGWNHLSFDARGVLMIGEAANPTSGSKTARELIQSALSGENVIVIEETNHRADVVFCKVVPGRWINGNSTSPPAYVVLVDFSDFDHLIGEKRLLAAFNSGWGVLHEISHVVDNSTDAHEYGEVGGCEALINQMRRECGLAERGEYFFTVVPGTTSSDFQTRLVRLAFDEASASDGKKKRKWLIWDAAVVGGLPKRGEVATLQ